MKNWWDIGNRQETRSTTIFYEISNNENPKIRKSMYKTGVLDSLTRFRVPPERPCQFGINLPTHVLSKNC